MISQLGRVLVCGGLFATVALVLASCAGGSDGDDDNPACDDGVDNDGDELIDYPDDPGCQSATDDDESDVEVAACNDGIDNDGDDLIDYPDDPGCFVPYDDDESDDCPDGVNCPACANGIDDDGDGRIDYGADPGCTWAGDDSELDQCLGVDVFALEPGGVSGTTAGSGYFVGSCASGSDPEDIYALRLERELLSLTFSTIGSAMDTVTYVRLDDCTLATAEIACENVENAGEEIVITEPVNGATYFVFVDGQYVDGDYVLSATGLIAGGDPCDPADLEFVCDGGHFCDGDSGLCEATACNDGDDNDTDSLVDYPDDPGCDNLDDNDESDDCPDGPGCPECANGIDDDDDDAIDWGSDPGCSAAADDSEDNCPDESDGVDILTAGTTSGTTIGLTHDFAGSCNATSTAPDKVFLLVAVGHLDSLTIDTEGSALDTVVYLKGSECVGTELECDDDGGVTGNSSLIELTDLAAGAYHIFVDGYSGASGTFNLNVHGVIGAGESCDPDLVTAGLFECGFGYACDGATCVLAACNDGVTNDADDLIDYPNDPGCASPSDNDEFDECPDGATCPACSDAEDNDADDLIDYPADPGCSAAGDDLEIDECMPGVEFLILSAEGASGTTPPAAAGSNFSPSCNGSTLSTEDVYVYRLEQTLLDLSFSTIGSTGDTVTAVRFGDCSDIADEIACADEALGEAVMISAPALGDYYIFVDGDYVSEIDYVLDVYGTVAAGDSCDPASPAFLCESGFVCTTDTCVASLCNNGGDDDGDELTDYPNDPGCEDISDNDESDDCPDGEGCPECSNGVDDDGDDLIDYPDDEGCASAASAFELNCADSDPILDFTESPSTGSTAGLTNDRVPLCKDTSTAPDQLYSLRIPGDLNTLSVSTDGSDYDTVLVLYQGSCEGAEFGCDDDDPTDTVAPLMSLIVVDDVPAGLYLISVDGHLTAAGDYQLNVSGEIAAAQPCDPAQTFFTCEGITTCSDPGSGYVCN